ncbi:MAG: tRNA epoxyqueuosine(34) reductase QueG [Terriglobia bacterium]
MGLASCLVYAVDMSLEQAIKESALGIGFDLIGVAPLEVGQDLDFARHWVEQGRGGEMNYLRDPKRHDPRQVLPSARSVVCAGLVYNSPLPYSTEVHTFPKQLSPEGAAPSQDFQSPAECPGGILSQPPVQTGWISRYAWGRDYHKVMKGKLEALRTAMQRLAPGVETRVYVDTGPMVERAFARFSGIGWMGKNTCLINQEKGSWFFLGVILTNLVLRPDLPAFDRCGSCRRCIEACPTGALDQPYAMDASRCIAYFTIELKGSIPLEFRPAMGVNVFGCDICQDVCPWNAPRDDPEAIHKDPEVARHPRPLKRLGRGAAQTTIPEFHPRRVRAGTHESTSAEEFSLFNPPLAALASMTEEEFRLNFKNSPMQRAKFQGFIRNACIALGNSRNRDLLPAIKPWAVHQNPVIREHAQWALAQIEKSNPPADRGI